MPEKSLINLKRQKETKLTLRKDEDVHECEEGGNVCDEQDFLVTAEHHRDEAQVNLAKGVEAIETSAEDCAVLGRYEFKADDEGG